MHPFTTGQEANRIRIRRLLSSLALALGLTLAVLAGLGGNLPRARADTYTVTNTNASGPGSLRQAILDANANAGHDTIDLSISGAIVLTDALPAISDDLTIIGPGADQLDISGANTYRMFTINGTAAVTITGLTVRDGKASWGGGVYVYEGSAVLNGMQVISNSAFSGGGVYVFGGSATLSGTQVVSNSAKYGGGIYVWNSDATLKVSGGEVISNSASDDGGGVCVLYGRAWLSGTQVISNSADYGGGVYVDDGSATLSGTQVVSNSARYGGGVYVDDGSVTLSGTRVVSNSASGHGGGVHVEFSSATLSVSGGEVSGNSASGDGGGVYVNQGSATLSGAQVVSNSADFGGGVYVYWGSATLNVSGGEVGDNSAEYGGGVYVNQGSATLSGTQAVSNPAFTSGGGVYVLYGSATLSGTWLVGNSASTSGGGVHVEFGGATLNGTQVVSNSADFGGGVYVYWGSATLNMSGGELDSNSASDGGGVHIDDGSATLSGTQVVSNSASWRGGGVYVNQGSATLNGTRVVSNSASWRGGGVYVNQGSATLNGTQVVSNSASYSGGGVYVELSSATLNVSGGELTSNSASEDGGGVYIEQGSATLNGARVVSNLASWHGGGVYVNQGSATLNGTQITANDATTGSGLYTGGTITPTTALTITGDIYQTGGRFAGSSHDLRVEGSLSLAGGDFCAPDAPNVFLLGGPFTHTGGVYHQTQGVTGSDDVGFPQAGGVLLNANGQDLGSTEVALTAGVDCAGVPAGEAVRHCYAITPTNASGQDAVITFFYRTGEMSASHTCAAMEAYRWTGAWDTRLTRDGAYGSDGRLCGPEPQSLRVTGVSTFSLFVLSVSPADVRISKLVTPAVAAPGDAITYTLTFSNAGAITATGVVITDTIPISVTNTGVISSGVAITRCVGTRYVWDVADLVQGAGGLITIMGVLSDPLASSVFANTAAITTTATDSDITNNSNSASVTVTTAAEITVRPLNLAFGDQDVDAGATVSQTVTITNDGGFYLNISSVSLTGTNAAEFKIESDSSENPLTPGSTRTVQVSFDPASVGNRSANLSIQSDDSDEPAIDVALSGTGTSVAVTYTLTVSKDGTGSGTVSSTPEGINCGAGCQAGFTDGTVVTLTAAAAGGSTFAGWAGEACSGTGACQVFMDAARQITATFDLAAGEPGYGSTPAPGSSINVGTASVGTTVSATLIIRETGDMTLMVTPTLSGADAADYGFAPTTLTILDGGAARDLTIGCTPSVTGTLAVTLTRMLVATLTVAHNAPGSPAVYPLSCTGIVLNNHIFLPLVLRHH